MKTRSTLLGLLMALTLLTVFCLSALASAQDNDSTQEKAVPRYDVLYRPVDPNMPKPDVSLQEWNGHFTYNSTQYNFVMVGADPATNQGALIPTIIIPLKIVLSDGSVWDPLAGGPFGALARTLQSPIFDKSTDYTQGGVDLGHTQYIDAFQRGNFWSIVQNNPNSHLLLGGPTSGITVLPEQTLNVPAGSGHVGSPFGHQVAEVGYGYLDGQIRTIMSQMQQIQPNTFPIFMTYNTYLTSGGCCIGGYHGNVGAQTYSHFTYIGYVGDFAQDVSALSHEVGEWADDPLYPTRNSTPCGILEVGDPLEGTNNYGGYPYTLHGFTYNLQDLVFLRYFGADPSTSVNDWWSFQNYPFTRICQNGS
jgi:hypothetical protein